MGKASTFAESFGKGGTYKTALPADKPSSKSSSSKADASGSGGATQSEKTSKAPLQPQKQAVILVAKDEKGNVIQSSVYAAEAGTLSKPTLIGTAKGIDVSKAEQAKGAVPINVNVSPEGKTEITYAVPTPPEVQQPTLIPKQKLDITITPKEGTIITAQGRDFETWEDLQAVQNAGLMVQPQTLSSQEYQFIAEQRAQGILPVPSVDTKQFKQSSPLMTPSVTVTEPITTKNILPLSEPFGVPVLTLTPTSKMKEAPRIPTKEAALPLATSDYQKQMLLQDIKAQEYISDLMRPTGFATPTENIDWGEVARGSLISAGLAGGVALAGAPPTAPFVFAGVGLVQGAGSVIGYETQQLLTGLAEERYLTKDEQDFVKNQRGLYLQGITAMNTFLREDYSSLTGVGGWMQKQVRGTPILELWATPKETTESAALKLKQWYYAQGLRGKKLDTAVSAVLIGIQTRSSATGAGFIVDEMTSNLAGGLALTKMTSALGIGSLKQFSKLPWVEKGALVAGATAPQGAGEFSSESMLSQIEYGYQGVQEFNPLEYGLGSGISVLTSGSFGFLLGATSPKFTGKAPRAVQTLPQKGVMLGGYTLDFPYEAIGDIGSGLGDIGIKKVSVISMSAVNAMSQSPALANVFANVPSDQIASNIKKYTLSYSTQPSLFEAVDVTKKGKPITVSYDIQPISFDIGIPSMADVQGKSDTPVPEPTEPTEPVPPVPPEPVLPEQPSEPQPQNIVNTETNVFNEVAANIPVMTSKGFLMPLFDIGQGGGGGVGGAGKGQLRYINELAYGLGFLDLGLGLGGVMPKPIRVVGGKKGRKAKKQGKRKQKSFIQSIGIDYSSNDPFSQIPQNKGKTKNKKQPIMGISDVFAGIQPLQITTHPYKKGKRGKLRSHEKFTVQLPKFNTKSMIW